jgi:hypothetical protein
MKKIVFFTVGLLAFQLGAVSSEKPQVTLGGEVGAADRASSTRFESAPYDSLAWIRADLTGEKASASDDAGWGHILFRPFKNFSGDISGRFIEIMALNTQGGNPVHPGYKTLLKALPAYQRPGGYFAASGEVDWQKPIDNKTIHTSTMMPVLWGNARLLCGLVEASRNDPTDTALLATARKLGDFYAGMLPRFADPARLDEYTRGDTYAAGYVTCYFPAMEGLVKLFKLTGEQKYLDTAVTMAAFYQQFDKLPIDHAHGMLCNQVALLLLYEATKDASYLASVEKRWDDLVAGGYINPAGGILEKCKVKFSRDEGCAIVDWFRLNLALGRVTGRARYWAMAERTLHNHLLQNQARTGGFGHRGALCDEAGVLGFKSSIEEATWCCTFHGQLAFLNLKDTLIADTGDVLKSPLAFDFSVKTSTSEIISVIEPAVEAGEVMRQRIRLTGVPAKVLQLRKPAWADAVQALSATGALLEMSGQEEYLRTTQPVTEAVFVFRGGVYAENRQCVRLPEGPKAGESCVLGYGPKLLAVKGRTAALSGCPLSFAQLHKEGFQQFSDAFRTNECCFVSVRAR